MGETNKEPAGYALRQHEEHKSKSKYLERPFDEAMRGLDKRLAGRIKRNTRRVVR
jgi:hypothetical protein